MMIDIPLKNPPAWLHAVLNVLASSRGSFATPKRLQTGMYRCGHWNFNSLIDRNFNEDPEWPDDADSYWNAYGVCDSPEQLLEAFGERLSDPARLFVVSLVKLRRDDEPPHGGWRWHKWGPYVGNQKPTTEFLYDEPLIEEVWTYHVYELFEEDTRKPCGACIACHNNQPCLDPS